MLDFDFFSEIYREYVGKYDRLILESLKSYGVTMKDIINNPDKVHYVEINEHYRHYFIDGVYAFSIITEYSFDYVGCKATMDCRVEVIEKMKGEKYG